MALTMMSGSAPSLVTVMIVSCFFVDDRNGLRGLDQGGNRGPKNKSVSEVTHKTKVRFN
jgi:hypothetical protein